MLFSELPLYRAVFEVQKRVEQPGSDEWIRARAKQAYKLVLQQIVDDENWTEQGIQWSMNQVLDVWMHLRKVPKARMICEVAAMHGERCFYFGRNIGECSADLDLDRIIPGSKEGEYQIQNCLIVCSRHNRSRGDLGIAEFLIREWARGGGLFT